MGVKHQTLVHLGGENEFCHKTTILHCYQFYFTKKLQYYLQSEDTGKGTKPSQIDLLEFCHLHSGNLPALGQRPELG